MEMPLALLWQSAAPVRGPLGSPRRSTGFWQGRGLSNVKAEVRSTHAAIDRLPA